jgi:subtilisin family serine protease
LFVGFTSFAGKNPSDLDSIKSRIAKEKRVLKVAVIDTGLDQDDPRFKSVLCKSGHKNFINGSTKTNDNHGHGTHIAGLIKKFAGDKGYCLVILKYFDAVSDGGNTLYREIQAIKWAHHIGADIVNFSGGGKNFEAIEYHAVKNAKNTMFFVAAGNQGKDISKEQDKFYPASYQLPNITVIGNVDSQMQRTPSSNYGDHRIIWEVGTNVHSSVPCSLYGSCEMSMTGTSQSTAVYTGKMIRRILRGK